ncbi:family 43 glycosylhydrolase [Echinicola sp. CAU 1574]|uniref:Family 43 glycosylhydrolase n=1 Tax=Echinicola arenosa TaxID=2774144 RepID=A0ABR9AF50_9BACT|nr:family 43 glycosylhydrolase [Echinicola arenosa]MBD8487288.1 family 43 glycosylhydrolase [Echinicola arenosa]
MFKLKYAHFLIILCVLAASACQAPKKQEEKVEDKESFRVVNPVLPGDHPDPTVIKIGDFYYASATSNEWAPLFPIFRSADLLNWEVVNYVFPDGAPGWAKNNFWAPELAYDEAQEKIYAYYTARDKESNRLSVAVASADTPEGSFRDHGPLVAQEAGSIDAFEVRDENGKLYLTWKEDGNSRGLPTPIWAQEINEERTLLMGEPHELFRNDVDWELNLVEGVCIFRENDYFYATYSAGSCCEKTCNYKAGVARAKRLLGPWEKYEQNPILKDNDNWKCAGHGTIVQKDGEHYLLYHAYSTDGSVYVGREGVLEQLYWTEDDWPYFKNHAKYDREKASLTFTDDFDPSIDKVWQWRVTQDIQYSTGEHGLMLQASGVNEGLGSLLVQTSTSPDYEIEVAIDPVHTNAMGGVLLVGGAHNGFGAPVAGMGIALSDDGIQVIENRDKQMEIKAQASLEKTDQVKLKMAVTEGHLLHFYFTNSDGNWEALGDTFDAAHLVPWGMGFRLGLFAKGANGTVVNFKGVTINHQ